MTVRRLCVCASVCDVVCACSACFHSHNLFVVLKIVKTSGTDKQQRQQRRQQQQLEDQQQQEKQKQVEIQ